MVQENLTSDLNRNIRDLATTGIELELQTLASLQRWQMRSKNPVMKQAAREAVAWSKRQIEFYTKYLRK